MHNVRPEPPGRAVDVGKLLLRNLRSKPLPLHEIGHRTLPARVLETPTHGNQMFGNFHPGHFNLTSIVDSAASDTEQKQSREVFEMLQRMKGDFALTIDEERL